MDTGLPSGASDGSRGSSHQPLAGRNSSRHALAVSQFGPAFYKYLFGKLNLGITTQVAEMEIIPNLKVFEVDAGAGQALEVFGNHLVLAKIEVQNGKSSFADALQGYAWYYAA